MSSWSGGGASEYEDGSETAARLTFDLMMVLWRPLSLILMVICLSERSGLMKGGWILTLGFFLGSRMYLERRRRRRMSLQAWFLVLVEWFKKARVGKRSNLTAEA